MLSQTGGSQTFIKAEVDRTLAARQGVDCQRFVWYDLGSAMLT